MITQIIRIAFYMGNPIFLLLAFLFVQTENNFFRRFFYLILICSTFIAFQGVKLVYDATHVYRYTFFLSGFAIVILAYELTNLKNKKLKYLLFLIIGFLFIATIIPIFNKLMTI